MTYPAEYSHLSSAKEHIKGSGDQCLDFCFPFLTEDYCHRIQADYKTIKPLIAGKSLVLYSSCRQTISFGRQSKED